MGQTLITCRISIQNETKPAGKKASNKKIVYCAIKNAVLAIKEHVINRGMTFFPVLLGY